ncbi:MAG: hypothetical protein RIE59_22090, partial [Imperialibacter sp.]
MKYTITHWTAAKYFALSICSMAILTACGDDEPALPDNLINFPSAQQSITEDESELDVVLSFSRALDVATADIAVELSGENIAYGTKFTTTPAASNNVIALAVAEGAEQASFTVSKVDGALFDGDEVITFTLSTSSDGLLPGTTATMTLSFAEILATQGQIVIEGGGATYPNKVFIDL